MIWRQSTGSDVDVKEMMSILSIDYDLSERHRAPVPFDVLLPTEETHPKCTIIRGSIEIGRGSKKIMTLGIRANGPRSRKP